MDIGGVKHGLWRAVDEHGAVLDVLMQEHRDAEAACSFFSRLLTEFEVPEVIYTDKLGRCRAAVRKIPVLNPVEHREVISAARCNNPLEQSHRPTREQERPQGGFRSRKRAQGFLALLARVSGQAPGGADLPKTRICITVPARRNPQLNAAITKSKPSSPGRKSYTRWLENRVAWPNAAHFFPLPRQLATTLSAAVFERSSGVLGLKEEERTVGLIEFYSRLSLFGNQKLEPIDLVSSAFHQDLSSPLLGVKALLPYRRI